MEQIDWRCSITFFTLLFLLGNCCRLTILISIFRSLTKVSRFSWGDSDGLAQKIEICIRILLRINFAQPNSFIRWLCNTFFTVHKNKQSTHTFSIRIFTFWFVHFQRRLRFLCYGWQNSFTKDLRMSMFSSRDLDRIDDIYVTAISLTIYYLEMISQGGTNPSK